MNTPPLPGLHEFAHGSAEYAELLRLRDLHLRQPLGLRLDARDREGEESQRHFALVDEGRIVGGVIAVPLPGRSAKLRQMWIDPDQRGRRLGRHLLEGVERILAAGGIRRLQLHARESAAGFYGKCGYHRTGDPFIETTLPHCRMEKTVVVQFESRKIL